MTDPILPKTVRDEARNFVVENCLSKSPVIILGSGASVRYKLPTMKELKDHILSEVEPKKKSAAEEETWKQFKKKLTEKHPDTGQEMDLETAMQKVPLHEHKGLYTDIMAATWKCIAVADQKAFLQFISGAEQPLSKLYKFLLASQNRRVTVITPNYDRIAEYAADMAGFCHRTGFNAGLIRGWPDPDRAPRFYRSDLRLEERTVDIWKVHGSIDWFRQTSTRRIVSLPLGLTTPELPVGMQPIIVPPGTGKFEETHHDPYRACMREADRALSQAEAFFCVGYGFNDSHLQERLVQGCRDGKKPLVLITYGLTPKAKELLIDGKLNCVAFEKSSTDGCTRIFTPEYRNGVDVEGPDLWDLPHFLTEML